MKMPAFKGQRLSGEIVPPPDKSITHRALLVGAMARKGFRIVNPLVAGDTCSTIDCLQKLGKNLRLNPGEISIEPGPLREASEILNCGNSGTTARLLSGILSAQNFFTVVDGDDSLKQRPMKRVVEPLRKMGAKIFGRADDSLLPLSIKGGPLQGSFFELDLPSAQVKSAIILAALSAEGTTVIKEKIKARDHLERMLRWLGINLKVQDKTITLEGKTQVEDGEISIPGDLSSAAFFISAAILASDSRIVIKDVGLNPTRIGFIRILERMGAKLSVLNLNSWGYEEVADLEVRAGSLKATEITGKEIPSLIDEIPLLALLGTQAEGITRITGANELRHKETDRIRTIGENLRKMGARVEELENGLIIEGPTPLRGNHLNSHGDHRIAMTLAIASIIAGEETYIEGFNCIRISYPDFLRDLYSLARF